MLGKYPQSTLQDIYKSFFQDRFGPRHIINDTVRAKQYLREEVENMRRTALPYYEPVGIEKNFYRVSLSIVKEKLVEEDTFFNAFIESSNIDLPTIDEWFTERSEILAYVPEDVLNYSADKARIDSLLATGNYAVHHSHQFNEAYHPHYRLIEKHIFETRLLPKIKEKIPRNTSSGNRNEADTRNVMLNASSSNRPREIQIGLPGTAGGTEIFEDGLPLGYYFWPLMPYMHWRSGTGYSEIGVMNIGESAMASGNVGYTVDSHSRIGGKKFSGLAVYTTNIFGAQRFEANASGPIARGWAYSADVFQNFDPGSAKFRFMENQDRAQIYKANVTKYWNGNRNHITFQYKYANTHVLSDDLGPFYYEGDGEVALMPGFNLGHDCYLPADGKLVFEDVHTGNRIESTYNDRVGSHTSEFFVFGEYNFANGMKLEGRLKYMHGNSQYIYNNLTGIDCVDIEQGFTLSDGKPYLGQIQNRYYMYYRGRTDDILGTFILSGSNGNHNWNIGLNTWFNSVDYSASTGMFAHTVASNPDRIKKDGEDFWNFNTGKEWYNGHEQKIALFAADSWQLHNRFNLYYGLRLESYIVRGTALSSPQKFLYHWITPISSIKMQYRIIGNLHLTGEYLFNRQRLRLENFAGFDYPEDNPVDVHLATAGFQFANDWINVTSQFSYISKSNFKSRVQFTKNVNGISETQTKPIRYNIATTGWTTDIILTPLNGLSLHFLATFQKPQYKNFTTTLTFSDNTSETYDYSNKIVTGISETLLEIDPSYTIGKWRVWLSARYYSRSYANKLNTIYFKGHWETFGGASFKVNNHLSFSANVVNILNQKGARGSIASADLVKETSAFQHYLMSGSYLRPFTVEFAIRLSI